MRLQVGQALPESSVLIVNHLNDVMHQCRRLQAFPELFPNPKAKINFMQQMATLSKLIADIFQAKSSTESIATDPQQGTVACTNSSYADNSAFKRPWTRWLENMPVPFLNPDWIAINQKLPLVGNTLGTTKFSVYHINERDFRRVCYGI